MRRVHDSYITKKSRRCGTGATGGKGREKKAHLKELVRLHLLGQIAQAQERIADPRLDALESTPCQRRSEMQWRAKREIERERERGERGEREREREKVTIKRGILLIQN